MFPAPLTTQVLVVDDAATTRDRLCAWLVEAGMQVAVSTADPDAALGCAEALRPDCIVIDVPVHDASGFSLLSELRGRCPGCMVIVMMNNLTDEVRRQCAAAGVRHCLDKASEFERVIDVVRDLGARR
jgi:two-component system, OmpR family, response regulator